MLVLLLVFLVCFILFFVFVLLEGCKVPELGNIIEGSVSEGILMAESWDCFHGIHTFPNLLVPYSIPPILFHILENKQSFLLDSTSNYLFPKQTVPWSLIFHLVVQTGLFLSPHRPHVQLMYSDSEDESLKLLHLIKKLIICN